jgi:hypothetical protein
MKLNFPSTARVIPVCVSILLLFGVQHVHGQQSKGTLLDRNPQRTASPLRFTSGDSALNIPFEFYENGILLRVRVNGKPLTFDIDTGSGVFGIISARRAESLGLKAEGKYKVEVPGGSIESATIPNVSISLPGVELSNEKLEIVPIDSSSPNGEPEVDGALGHNFLEQFVVEIDYAAKVINLYSPATYHYSGAGESIPITIRDSSPSLRIKMMTPEGMPVEGQFELDTGLSGTLAFFTPSVRKNKLIRSTKTIEAAVDEDAGGEYRSRIGRMKTLQLGRFVIQNPNVRFSLAGADDSSVDGVIGTEILRRFKMILDYQHQRIILEPNAHFDEPYDEDMSGLALAPENNDRQKVFKIKQVLANTPASDAGLLKGDLIVAINNRPAAEFNLDQIEHMFIHDGQEFVISIKRNQQSLQTKIKLRRLI